MLSIRKIGVIGRTYRHLNRYRQILSILFKYGFGDLVESLKIDQYIEIGLQMISRRQRPRDDKLTRAERVRMALEELGPTYVKLGQTLSTRPDLIPVEFTEELAKLLDEVPPCSFEAMRTILEGELKRPTAEVFSRFDPQPLASASIGQVHRARRQDGDEVAVKVQRPGIRKVIEVDLEIMLHLATLMERHIEELALHRPVRIVEEFARTIERELDYTLEATHMERIAQQFLDDPRVYIPAVYHDATTERVLTMEYVSGIKVSEVAQLKAAGLDPKVITDRGADLFLRQVFDFGFFHADPHPGNIQVLAENVICLLDFGMVGSVDRATRELFVDLIDAVVHRNEVLAAQAMLRLTEWQDEPDIRRLERDVADFMGRNLYRPLKEIKIGRIVQQLLEMVSAYRLRIPPNIFLMMKAFSTVESVAARLNPDFDMIAKSVPFLERVKLARYSPQRMTQEGLQLGAELMYFARQFPRDLLEVTRLLKQRKIALQIDIAGYQGMRATQDQTSNRLAFAIIIAALLIGSALIVISETPPLVYGISLIGILLFSAGALMGIWLLIAILRKGSL
ncbi:MAG TPA: AarF/UbiB family protein [Desulfobacterales bacterium]|jgi:ubiquinone biosynthesis protein|nr:AarF/UbiB family protein [Desulfobacterales bacterium]